MNTRSKIRVLFLGKDVNPNLKKGIEEEVTKRMSDNGCSEGASVTFYFDNIVRKRSSSGVYVSKVQAVDIVVVVRHNSNEAVRGNLKPGTYEDGKKMTVAELEKFLTPVIKKKSIQPRTVSPSEPAETIVTLSPEVESPKIPYTQVESFAPEFKALFVECLPVFFKEAGFEQMAARDLAPLFNESKNSFCESGKCMSVRMVGMLLSKICDENNVLEMANNGRPYAVYKLIHREEVKVNPETAPEEIPASIPDKQETPVPFLDRIEDLKRLLQEKKSFEGLKQKAKRDLVIARETLTLAEAEYERLENDEKTVDAELEQYRELYQALNGVFKMI